jgi:hypothetical protein
MYRRALSDNRQKYCGKHGSDYLSYWHPRFRFDGTVWQELVCASYPGTCTENKWIGKDNWL